MAWSLQFLFLGDFDEASAVPITRDDEKLSDEVQESWFRQSFPVIKN